MVISRVITRLTPFRALITRLITYLLSPLPLQVLASAQTPSCRHLEADTVHRGQTSGLNSVKIKHRRPSLKPLSCETLENWIPPRP